MYTLFKDWVIPLLLVLLYASGYAQVCSPPTNLSGVASGTSIQVTWPYVSAASEYYAQYKLSNTDMWSRPIYVSGNYITLYGLEEFTSYDVAVFSVCGTGISQLSNHVSVTTGYEANYNGNCRTPGFVDLNPKVGETLVVWEEIKDPDTWREYNYQVAYKPSHEVGWHEVPGYLSNNRYTFTGLNSLTRYDVRVRTVCGSGASFWTSTYTFLTPASNSAFIPTGFVVSTSENPVGSARATWNATPNTRMYELQAKPKGGTTWESFGSVETFFDLNSLAPGTAYTARVRSHTIDNLESGWSPEVEFITPLPNTCAPPSSASASIYGDQAYIRWAPVPLAKQYEVSYKKSYSPDWDNVIRVTYPNFGISGVSDYPTYQYKVRTICATGVSNWSSVYTFSNNARNAAGLPSFNTAYPNPNASGVFYLRAPVEEIRVTDVLGKTVWEQNAPTHQINLSDQPAGVYQAQVKGTDGLTQTIRLVKN